VGVGLLMDSQFSWHLYIGCIARSSLRYLSFLVDRLFTVVCRQRPTRKLYCMTTWLWGRETARTVHAVVKFDTYRNLQQHCSVLPAIAQLSCYLQI